MLNLVIIINHQDGMKNHMHYLIKNIKKVKKLSYKKKKSNIVIRKFKSLFE